MKIQLTEKGIKQARDLLWQRQEEAGDDFENQYGQYYHDVSGGSSIPAGCRACGGPYPGCKDSCPLFEDE